MVNDVGVLTDGEQVFDGTNVLEPGFNGREYRLVYVQ